MTTLAAVTQPGDPHARPTTHQQQGDTVKPYTDADVELVARAWFDAEQRRIVAEHPLLPVVPTRWSDVLPTARRRYEYDARAVLEALADAGWRRTDPPRPTQCPATVGDGHAARRVHPDGECQRGHP